MPLLAVALVRPQMSSGWRGYRGRGRRERGEGEGEGGRKGGREGGREGGEGKRGERKRRMRGGSG